MKILLLNRDDSEGGAAKGATRLLQGIRSPGVDASLYVQRKMGNSPYVMGPPAILGKAAGFVRRILESLLYSLSTSKRQGLFSPAFFPDRISSRVSSFEPDIIHLHWVARMMRLETLSRFNVPIVWTLHDSWPFTGGCFLPLNCTRYQKSCGACPILGSSREEDLSRRVWRRKNKAWEGLNLTLVAPSQWMADRARMSSLFHKYRIEVIPNGIDVQLYQPFDRRSARKQLSLPQDKRLILFGAKDATEDRNKGFHLLVQSLQVLAGNKWRDDIELLVLGSKKPNKPQYNGFITHYLGWQHDDANIALLYAAADVFVLPSIQENLPYTVMEAMACGTPCVAFDIGGVPDLIEHKQNGYLAQCFDTVDLAHGIAFILEDDERSKALSAHARHKVEREFALESVTQRHLALYRSLLNPNGEDRSYDGLEQ